MALEPYRNQSAYEGVDTRDVGLPQVDGVIDLRGTVDKIAGALTPGIDKKNRENAQRDAVQAVGKDEKGNYVRARMDRNHGSDYEAVFEKAAGNLHKLDILSRTEQSFNDMMKDPTLANDPAAMASAMTAYRQGVLETVDPDIAIEVDELVRREASQRLLTASNRVQAETRQSIAKGTWNHYQAVQQQLVKLTSLPGYENDQSVLDNISRLRGQQDLLAGNLIKMHEASPEYFQGEDIQVETAMVDYTIETKTREWKAKNGFSAKGLEPKQIETLIEVLGGNDVPEELRFEVGGLKTTVADFAKMDRSVMGGLRGELVQELNRRDQKARDDAAEERRKQAEIEDDNKAREAAAYVEAGGKMTAEQRVAADKAFMVAGGILSEDGMTANPTAINAFMTEGGGQQLAIRHFETYREMPQVAVDWMETAFQGGNHMGALSFINNAREARSVRTGARVGDAVFAGLPAHVKSMFFAGSTMTRGGFPEPKIKLVMERLARREPVPPRIAMDKIGEDYQEATQALLKRSYPGLDPTRMPRAMHDDYRDMLNLVAFAAEGLPKERIMAEAVTHLRSAWSTDPKFLGGAGPTKFVSQGFSDGELRRAVGRYRKDQGLRPLDPVADFARGTLQLRPRQSADPRANFGTWEVVLVEPRSGRQMGSFDVDMDFVNQHILSARKTLAPQRNAIIQVETRARRASRNSSQQRAARQTMNDRPGQ